MGLIVMVMGLPGTGKSTFGRQLQKRLGVTYLNTDLVREQLGKKGAYDPQTIQLVYTRMVEQAEQHLQQGEDVIVDATFHLARRREMIYRLARNKGHQLVVVEIKAREATLRERLQESRPHSEAGWEVYRKIRDEYQPPAREHLQLWSDRLTMEEMINHTIQRINESEADRAAD